MSELVSRQLLYTYPVDLRDAYKSALAEHDAVSRHKALIRLAEVGLEVLASMALSDYRTRRWNDPSPKVESLIAKVRRPSLGHYLELLRTCLPAARPGLLDFKQGEQQEDLPACGRLASAIDGVQDAIDLEARNIARVIGKRLEGTTPKVDWLQALDLVVAYRNRADGHSAEHQWPVEHPDYFILLTPIVEEAITEMLCTTHLARVFEDHPFAVLRDVHYRSGVYEHVFDADDGGVPVRTAVSLDRSLTDLYSDPGWCANVGGSYLLTRTPSGGFEFLAIYHDLRRQGMPEAMQTTEPQIAPKARPSSPPSTSTWRVGTASAVGTCGELVQGPLPEGRHFHVTCPIRKSSTVNVRMRPSDEWRIENPSDGHEKLERSLQLAAELLDLGPMDMHVDHWSDLDVGKGMGSSTADIVAAARAVGIAAGRELTESELAAIAVSIESSDGSMCPGIVAFRQRTGDLVHRFKWWPQFAVVMVIPPNRFNTESADFAGKDRFADEFAALLDSLIVAEGQGDGAAFARAATRSARINQRFVPNPWFDVLHSEYESLGAAGVNIGHTGTVAGLLYPIPDSSSAEIEEEERLLISAAKAVRRIQELLPRDVSVELTMTPASPTRS